MPLVRHITPVIHPGNLLNSCISYSAFLILATAFQLCYTVSWRDHKDVNCLCYLLQQTVAHQNSDFTIWLPEAEAGKSALPCWWAIASKNESKASFISPAAQQDNSGPELWQLHPLWRGAHFCLLCFLLLSWFNPHHTAAHSLPFPPPQGRRGRKRGEREKTHWLR